MPTKVALPPMLAAYRILKSRAIETRRADEATACRSGIQGKAARITAPLEATTALWGLLEEGHVTSRFLKARDRRVAPSVKHVFARCSEIQHIEILLNQASLSPRLSKSQCRRINGFVGQLESAEMHPQAATRPQVEVRLHRFLWVHVMSAHEPSWLIGPDRKECEIDAWKFAPDFCEVRAVARISSEIDHDSSDFDDEPTP